MVLLIDIHCIKLIRSRQLSRKTNVFAAKFRSSYFHTLVFFVPRSRISSRRVSPCRDRRKVAREPGRRKGSAKSRCTRRTFASGKNQGRRRRKIEVETVKRREMRRSAPICIQEEDEKEIERKERQRWRGDFSRTS